MVRHGGLKLGYSRPPWGLHGRTSWSACKADLKSTQYKKLCGSLVHVLKFESCKQCKTNKLKARFIGKVNIFSEGHKILWNLHPLFVLCTTSQIIGGDFAKFCGLQRIYEF